MSDETQTPEDAAVVIETPKPQTLKEVIASRSGVDFHSGASYPMRRAQKMTPSSREVKLLRPECVDCEKAAGGLRYLDPLWFENCPHDPYVSIAQVQTKVPIYEPLDPANPSGPQRIVREEVQVTFVPKPNWTSATHASGVNKGRGVHKALWKGCIYPQQLRSPIFPEGIKMRCMFRDCYSEDIKQYQSGWFCREYEAKMVMLSDTETTWEYGEFSKKNDAIRKRILDTTLVGL